MKLLFLMLKRFALVVITILILLFGSRVYSSSMYQGIPKPFPTTLPIDSRMEKQDNQNMLDFLRNDLIVYEDTENPHVYYYMPKFVAVPGRAATVLVNDKALKRRDDIEDLALKIFNMNISYASSLAQRQDEVSNRLAQMEAEQPTSTETTKLLREVLANIQAEIKQFDDKIQSKLGQHYQKAAYQQLANLLGLSGFPISETDIKNTEKRTKVLAALSKSNGGVFTVNIHAPLGERGVKLVRQYHQERHRLGLPRIRILKLPVEEITWEALAETVANTEGKEGEKYVGIPLPRKISGGGHWDGSTINMDLTLDGATKFLSANPAMILPVYATAKTLKKYPRFRAVLECDYSVGWTVKGRIDLKDGRVIYDNDIYKRMLVSEDVKVKKPCNLRVLEGERKYAELGAIEALEKQFRDTLMKRINLASSEKEAYYNKVMTDVQETRASRNHRTPSDNFFWHTHTEDMKKLSTFKWKEEIVSNGLKSVIVDVPVRVCVVFKPNEKEIAQNMVSLCHRYKELGLQKEFENCINRITEVELSYLLGGKYVACSNKKEDEKATTVTEAHEKAMKSQECQGVNTARKCGQNRAQEAPTDPITGNVQSFPDEL